MKFDLIKVEEKYIRDNSKLAFHFESKILRAKSFR